MVSFLFSLLFLGMAISSCSGFVTNFAKLQSRKIAQLRAKKGGNGNGNGNGKGNGKASPEFIVIEDFYSDSWMLEAAVEKLKQGKIGVIPTDTCYSFVGLLSNRKAVEAVMKVKGSGKKPLSVLCKNLSMVDRVSSDVSREKWV